MDVSKIISGLVAMTCFFAGYHFHSYMHECPTVEPQIVTEYKDRVVTEVVYVPKEKDEKTDVDIQISKPELHVKVNEKDFIVKKTDDEKYIFDKNKLSLTQTSRSDIHIDVPTIDNTKRWEVGIGISKDGMVGLLGFPVKGEHVGGFVAGNNDYQMAGLTIRF